MTTQQYNKIQDFQKRIFDLVDSYQSTDTVFGNELFQRMADAAFDVFENHDNDLNPADKAKVSS